MPFYEYECSSCKFYLEVMQKISESPLRKCPSCGKNTLKKLVSAPAFRLKGEGWYETDFKSDKEAKRNLAIEKDAEPKEAKPAETTSGDAAKAESPPAAAKPAESADKPAAESKRRRKTVVIRRKPAARAKPKPKARSRRKGRR
ncbi:MAG: FmdB family zinc ribbon protein [Gammaproteobacteria bacterium]